MKKVFFIFKQHNDVVTAEVLPFDFDKKKAINCAKTFFDLYNPKGFFVTLASAFFFENIRYVDMSTFKFIDFLDDSLEEKKDD